MKKIISKSLYNLYDLLNKGALGAHYKKAKHHNDKRINHSEEELSAYLKKWGFEEELEKNPLMVKADVVNWVQKVNPKSVHSWAYTGGSYGEPLKIPYSKNRSLIRTATFKYFNEQGGYQLGDAFALIRAKDKSGILKFFRNETIIIPYDVSSEKIGLICQEIANKKIRTVMGYPTVLYEIALLLKENEALRQMMSVKHIISVSEMLNDEKRQVIFEVFNCDFIDRYSNEEVGLIAQQKAFEGPYFVNKYGVIVEVLDPVTLMPTKEGETGKVVVTDILNDLVPMVRYDTGDLAIVAAYSDNRLDSISKILGRVTETLFDIQGNPVSSLALGPCIYKPFSNAYYTHQFQLAQTELKEYELRIMAKEDDFSQEVCNTINRNLVEVLGQEAKVIFRFVNDITPQSSGKRPVYKYEVKHK